jgi:predicted DNA-binding ribbon-helix-helix protein
MAQDTATIRVPRPVRDSLARSARDRGTSVATLIAHLAERLERDSMLRSERDATLRDAGSATVAGEERDWDQALADGLD